MKILTSIIIVAYMSSVLAFDINGTNVTFRFENQNLDTTTKSMIESDLLRRIAPTLHRASIRHSFINNKEIYSLENLTFNSPTPLSRAVSPNLTLRNEGTNFILRISNNCVGYYESKIQLYNANTNAIKQAWDFADYLNNSDIQNMSTNELRNLRLVKGYEPDDFSPEDLLAFRKDLQGWNFYHPSIAEFQMIKCGPNNGTYLWGILPCKKDEIIDCFPIIYINGKWMISFWMYEESLLGM